MNNVFFFGFQLIIMFTNVSFRNLKSIIFQVKVEMTDVVNCALHVSVNSGTDSEVEVTVDRSFNSSIHLRYILDKLLNNVR